MKIDASVVRNRPISNPRVYMQGVTIQQVSPARQVTRGKLQNNDRILNKTVKGSTNVLVLPLTSILFSKDTKSEHSNSPDKS